MQSLTRIVAGLLFSFMVLFAAEQKAVFDLTTGDAATIEKHLVKNIEGLARYYQANDISFKAVVVISGNAYKYFVHDLEHSPFRDETELTGTQKKLAPLLAKLHREYQVEFDMCRAGRRARNIDMKVLYDYVQSDKNKSVYLIMWQNRGYAYLPVH